MRLNAILRRNLIFGWINLSEMHRSLSALVLLFLFALQAHAQDIATADSSIVEKPMVEAAPVDTCRTDSCVTLHRYLAIYDLHDQYPDSALALYEEIITYSDENGYFRCAAGARLRRGQLFKIMGRMVEANESFKDLLALGGQKGNLFTQGSAYVSMGNVDRELGSYDRAIKNFKEALWRFEKADRLDGVATAMNNLAMMYKFQEQYEEAIKYYRQAINLSISLGDKGNVTPACVNLGLTKLIVDEPDSAEYFVRMGLRNLPDDGPKWLRARVYSNFVDLFLETNQLDSAEHYLALAEEYTAANRISRQAVLQILRSTIERKRLNYERSNFHALEALAILDSTPYLEERKTAYLILFRNARDVEDFEQALNYHLDFRRISDSLYNIEAALQLEVISSDYAWEKQEKELAESRAASLEAEQKYAEEAVIRRNLTWVASGLVVIAIIVLLFYRKVRGQKKVIESALEEKEVLMGEIHHRVKNNLQLISSILELQVRNISDEHAVLALRESQNKVQAMSLIHQKLYQTSHFHQINARDYLDDLVHTLVGTLTQTEQAVEMEVQLDPVKLSLDQAIPLGLIVTELVNNAFKHGYDGQERGKLEIKLEEGTEVLSLTVRNDGRPLQAGLGQGFGLKMIRSLTRQLKGNFELSAENGTLAALQFQPV